MAMHHVILVLYQVACQVQDLQHWLDERSAMTELIQHNLSRAQNSIGHSQRRKRVFCWRLGLLETSALCAKDSSAKTKSQTELEILWAISDTSKDWEGGI